MAKTVHVMAVLTAKPGQRQALIEAFRQIVLDVLAEDGCITYVPSIDAADAGEKQAPLGENTVVVVEEWESLAHLDAHGKTAHMQAFGGVAGPLIADRKIHILSGV
ncbi:putative quinol monooxygenase [Oceaniglobus indicus]|uniref:putative quinol monooxygenase n=1 Tax=Oceaniglobus indicus TaxID=2047749 RepID=UPI000C19CB13|nr:putative quinol monooxygenase [Oceaniglobus indicus]